jgi:hypothetical protein
LKAIRVHLIALPGQVMMHARQLIVRLGADHPSNDLLMRVRQGIRARPRGGALRVNPRPASRIRSWSVRNGGSARHTPASLRQHGQDPIGRSSVRLFVAVACTGLCQSPTLTASTPAESG